MLAIEVSFLTGRYVATAYNTRTEGEWPPHPARLFSALVATHFADGSSAAESAGERDALEWLEGQGAPDIAASQASCRDVATVFVPVNDVASTDVDREAADADQARSVLAAARADGDAKAIARASRNVTKAETALSRAIRRATAVPERSTNPRAALRVMPEHRTRQPRTFPSVTPEQPVVTYVWPAAHPEPPFRACLDALLARVVRVGHSSSLVSCRLVDQAPSIAWRPSSDGELTLRVVQPGQLQALTRAFEQHQELEPRVMPARPQAYERAGAQASTPVERSVFSDDWLVLRRVAGPHLPMTAAAGLARTIRKALLSYAEAPAPEVLSGHAADGHPTLQPHLAIVPLPFVGHVHASGAVHGVALVLPRAADHDARRTIYAALARWEGEFRIEDEDTPPIKVNLGQAGELWLERVEWATLPTTLKPSTWCRAAQVWYSVTPVALDRNPGDLWARDPRKLADATGEAIACVTRACVRLGLPSPRYVEILPAAPLAGAAKARAYPAFPEDANRTRRTLCHVRLEFESPVAGPVILGAGRFVGLGLFRPQVAP